MIEKRLYNIIKGMYEGLKDGIESEIEFYRYRHKKRIEGGDKGVKGSE